MLTEVVVGKRCARNGFGRGDMSARRERTGMACSSTNTASNTGVETEDEDEGPTNTGMAGLETDDVDEDPKESWDW